MVDGDDLALDLDFGLDLDLDLDSDLSLNPLRDLFDDFAVASLDELESSPGMMPTANETVESEAGREKETGKMSTGRVDHWEVACPTFEPGRHHVTQIPLLFGSVGSGLLAGRARAYALCMQYMLHGGEEHDLRSAGSSRRVCGGRVS